MQTQDVLRLNNVVLVLDSGNVRSFLVPSLVVTEATQELYWNRIAATTSIVHVGRQDLLVFYTEGRKTFESRITVC